jgi:hypothetical protein
MDRKFNGSTELPVNSEHAIAVDDLPRLHKDPSDRISANDCQGCVLSDESTFPEYRLRTYLRNFPCSPRSTQSGRTKEKGLPKKAFQIDSLVWLPYRGKFGNTWVVRIAPR